MTFSKKFGEKHAERKHTLTVSSGIPLRTPLEAIVTILFLRVAGDSGSTAYPEEVFGCRERK